MKSLGLDHTCAGDLSQQQTLKLVMAGLQKIPKYGQADQQTIPESPQNEKSDLTVDHILHEITNLGDTVATLIKKRAEAEERAGALAAAKANSNTPPSNIDNYKNKKASKTSKVPSRFNFRRLPSEIRLIIYGFAFPERLLMFHPEGSLPNLFIGMKPLPLPAIALTCREAYHFSREHYKRLCFEPAFVGRKYWTMSPPERDDVTGPPSFHAWFNPDRDALLIDLSRADDDEVQSSFSLIPLIYNRSRRLSGWSREIRFSELARCLRPFATIAKHVVLRRGPRGGGFGIHDQYLYGFREIFPSLQRISLVVYEFVYSDRALLKPSEVFKLEDPAILLDPYNKGHTDQITTMVETNSSAIPTPFEVLWKRYLAELGNPGLYSWGPLVQKGSRQRLAIESLAGALAELQVYADTAYQIDGNGDRIYENHGTWKRSTAPAHESEIAARREQLPAVRPACLVMEPAWEVREKAWDPRMPSQTGLCWTLRRGSGSRGKTSG